MKGFYKRKKHMIIAVFICFISAVVIYCAFEFHYNRVYQLLLDKDITQMKDTSHFVTKLIESEIEHIVSQLHVNQRRLITYENQDEMIENLKNICHEMNFEKVGIVDLEGHAIDEYGNRLTLQDPQLLDAMLHNKEYISNVVDESDMLLIASPMMDDGHMIGGLWGYYRVENIAKTIEINQDSHRYFQIIDNTGHYISASSNVNSFTNGENLWVELETYDLRDTTVEEVKKNMQLGYSGEFYFSYQGQGRYVTYEPLGMNDWYAFSVLTEDYLTDYVSDIEDMFSLLLWIILGCIGLVLVMSGRTVYMSMNKIRHKNQELEARQSLLFMVMKHTNDIPFEIDIQKRMITIYHSYEEEMVVQESIENYFPEKMLEKGYLHPEDFELYKHVIGCMINLQYTKPVVLRFFVDGAWSTKKVHYHIINDDAIVGFLEDYSELALQHKKIKEMNLQSQLDALTQLYNRNLFQCEVEKILEDKRIHPSETYSALLIVDIDFFKQANDTLGHMVGDQILRDCAMKLKSVMRNSDVCGRLGGDEFVLFIQGAKDLSAIEACAQKVNDALYHTYYQEGKSMSVSASIGVAVFKNEATFNALYELADKALYKVKENNKNNYYVMTLESEK